MKLLMARSSDGRYARGPDDDMTWTGRTDKKVFRALTNVGGVCFAGRRTYYLLRTRLPGRRVAMLSRDDPAGFTLGEAWKRFPDSWLLGGQEVAMEALQMELLDEVHLSLIDVALGEGPHDDVRPWIAGSHRWTIVARVPFDEITVLEQWRRL